MTAASISLVGRIAGRIERAGNAEDGVEIGNGREGKFSRSGAEGSDVSADQFAIQRECFAAASLEVERDLNVSSRHFFFKQAAELHLERIGSGRKPEVEIEEAMVDRL